MENSTEHGIKIANHIGSINLNGIISNTNAKNGLEITSTGNVSVSNSVFNENTRSGVLFTIIGTTTLNNVVANGNDQYGVLAENTSSMTIKNVITTSNAWGGLHIETLGAVTVINSSTNGDRGTPNNQGGDGLHIETSGAVNITGLGAYGNDENGLFVRTKGAITIFGIYAFGNGFSGADLDNCLYDGKQCLGTGSINLRNASGKLNELTDNDHFGLWALSKGAITITNLRANENDSDGAYLRNSRGGSTAPITVNTLGAVRNDFSRNGWYQVFNPPDGDYYQVLCNGLSALSAGNISVINTDAYQNQYTSLGIYLDSKSSSAPRTVTLVNSSASENDWAGVMIFARGNVTLTNVTANNNGGDGGIHVDNCLDWVGGEDGICLGNGTVHLTKVNAHNNGNTGIQVLSKGLITLLGADAGSNSNTGIYLRNNYSGAAAGMAITNINANDNNDSGLVVLSNGSADLANINTHNNARRHGGIGSGQTVQDFFNNNQGPEKWWFDAVWNNTQNVTLRADALWDLNRTDFDPWIELYDGDTDTQIGVAVDCLSVEGECSFEFLPSDFSYIADHSFYVLVGSSSNDGFYHLSLNDFDPGDGSTQMFWVNGVAVTVGGSITVRDINSSNNSLVGLGSAVTGNGNITLSNMGIYGNGAEGVYLTCGQTPDFSDSGFGTGTITISGSNSINDNGWDGLFMATSGAVNISNMDASFNGQETGSSGVRIRDDCNATTVTLNNINVGENGANGLFINATGNITLTNISAWNNFGEAGIDMANTMGSGTIRLTKVTSNNNQGIGIDLYSNGLITLNEVQANSNWGPGICLKNDFDGASAGIVLRSVRADNNGGTGITALTNGALVMSTINTSSNAIVWSGIDASTTVQEYFNQGKGPDHWWFDAQASVPITLKLWADGWSDYDSGWMNPYDFDPFIKVYDDQGSEITSNQSVSFQYLSADMHHDFYQIVWTPTSDGSYYLEVGSTYLGTDFDGNSGFYRLSIDDPDPSDPEVFWVDGLGYDAGGNVSLSGTNNFIDNEQAGLIGWSGGNVTLANLFSWGNGCEGILVDNTAGSGNITLSGANGSLGNGWEGLRVETNGAVSISNLEASNNGQDGIRIVANTDLKTVTLTNIVALWNGISGLEMEKYGGTNGLTTLNNVRAWFNGEDGANVDTHGYNLTLLNSSFMCNGDDGFVYWDYPLPIIFTNIGNIFLGNSGDDLLIKYMP